VLYEERVPSGGSGVTRTGARTLVLGGGYSTTVVARGLGGVQLITVHG